MRRSSAPTKLGGSLPEKNLTQDSRKNPLKGTSSTINFSDDYGAVESSEVVYDGVTSLFEYTLIRDEFGRIIQQTESVEGDTPVVWLYQYDERGRLKRADRDSLYVEYRYDDNGNPIQLTRGGSFAKSNEER